MVSIRGNLKPLITGITGFLNWVMEMSADEVKTAIGGINGQMTQAQREHLVDTNKIAAWLDDNVVITPDAASYVGGSMKKKIDYNEISKARAEKLYPNYESWCDDGAVHPLSLNRFTANILDVCGQLKIDAIGLPKDRHGKSVKGITIRGNQHFNYATPITKKLIGDAQLPVGDLSVTRATLDSSHGDLLYPKNLSVIKTPVIESLPHGDFFEDSELVL